MFGKEFVFGAIDIGTGGTKKKHVGNIPSRQNDISSTFNWENNKGNPLPPRQRKISTDVLGAHFSSPRLNTNATELKYKSKLQSNTQWSQHETEMFAYNVTKHSSHCC